MNVTKVLDSSFRILSGNFGSFFIASVIFMIASIIIIPYPPLIFGLFYMANKAVKGEKPVVKDVFKGFRYFVKSWVLLLFLLASSLVLSLCIFTFGWIFSSSGVLFILVILPFIILKTGLILAIAYTIPIIIERDAGIFSAIGESFRIVRRKFFTTVVVGVLMMIIHFILDMTIIGMGLSYVVPAIALTIITLED